MRLYYIRHAQSENNHLWDSTGSNKGRSDDPLLTTTGIQQADAIAAFLGNAAGGGPPQTRDLQQVDDFRITHIYCSLMERATATGNTIARALGLPLTAWADLHEVGGIYLEDETTGELIGRAGKNRAYYERHFPDCRLPDSVTDAGWWNRPFELTAERLPRAQRVWRELLDRHSQSDDCVAIVSHGAFFNFLIAAAIGLPDPSSSPYWFLLNNVSISRIDCLDGQVGVVYTNRVDYLPRRLVT